MADDHALPTTSPTPGTDSASAYSVVAALGLGDASFASRLHSSLIQGSPPAGAATPLVTTTCTSAAPLSQGLMPEPGDNDTLPPSTTHQEEAVHAAVHAAVAALELEDDSFATELEQAIQVYTTKAREEDGVAPLPMHLRRPEVQDNQAAGGFMTMPPQPYHWPSPMPPPWGIPREGAPDFAAMDTTWLAELGASSRVAGAAAATQHFIRALISNAVNSVSADAERGWCLNDDLDPDILPGALVGEWPAPASAAATRRQRNTGRTGPAWHAPKREDGAEPRGRTASWVVREQPVSVEPAPEPATTWEEDPAALPGTLPPTAADATAFKGEEDFARSFQNGRDRLEPGVQQKLRSRLWRCIDSLYRDRLLPYIGEVMRRLAEQAPDAPLEVRLILNVCAGQPETYRIMPPSKYEEIRIMLVKPHRWCQDQIAQGTWWVTPDTPDTYCKQLWEVFRSLVQDDKLELGRDPHEASLKIRQLGIPLLAFLTLGELRHMVEIALGTRKLLTYVDGVVRPVQVAEKRRHASRGGMVPIPVKEVLQQNGNTLYELVSQRLLRRMVQHMGSEEVPLPTKNPRAAKADQRAGGRTPRPRPTRGRRGGQKATGPTRKPSLQTTSQEWQ